LTRALTQEIHERVEQEYQAKLDQQLALKADEYELRVAAEREKARQDAMRQDAVQRQAAQEELAAVQVELAQRRDAELTLLREKRELEAAKATLALDLERRVAGERQRIEAQVRDALSEQYRLKELEKDRQLEELRQQLAEAHRRADQGSQQRQGEVLELDLEARLHEVFPHDRVEPVAKGARGGDVVHVVCDSRGQVCGTILWEAKNTKTYSDDWLSKLRADQREKNADVSVLVTASLPKDIPHFALRGSVWVTGLSTWLPLAAALRAGLIDTARARQAQQGQAEKQAVLYRYLSGVEFRQRIGGYCRGCGCAPQRRREGTNGTAGYPCAAETAPS